MMNSNTLLNNFAIVATDDGKTFKFKNRRKCEVMYHDEILMVAEKYNISSECINLLYELSFGVINSYNIICSLSNNPLTKDNICKEFGISKIKFNKNIKVLIEFKLICDIQYSSEETYYVMNPYLMNSGDVENYVFDLFKNYDKQTQIKITDVI